MEQQKIKKAYVVFMTHFDMGFTNLSDQVLQEYLDKYIPEAMKLAKELNFDEKKRFIWTIDPFLLIKYLEEKDEKQIEYLNEAVYRGDISWHGLAFTTHTELMNKELLDFDLQYSDWLDRRYQKSTIAGKMTDVPGHTCGLIEGMRRHKKCYLHIGVNSASMNPEVPDTFLWKTGKEEIVVQYSAKYGSTCYVEGMEEALEFVFLGDNQGIPSKEYVLESLEKIHKKYPNGIIEVSDLNAYALKVWENRNALPVVTEEIGDTWIHGIASDPIKTMALRRLCGLAEEWVKQGKLLKTSLEYRKFMENLLIVCEHTWGLDYKKYLADFKNWRKIDFQKARGEKLTLDDCFSERNQGLLLALSREKDMENFTGSYRVFENACKEQRKYLENAVVSLPQKLQEEVAEHFLYCEKRKNKMIEHGIQVFPMEMVTVGRWSLMIDYEGSLIYLKKGEKELLKSGKFGRVSYEVYDAKDCVGEFLEYNHNFQEDYVWAEADFSKPGLENVEELKRKNYTFRVQEITKQNNMIEISLDGKEEATCGYGCPRKMYIRYVFEEEIFCEIFWKEKDANKIPEALWFEWNFDVENPNLWKMDKMGKEISPLCVVRGGNRRQHCVNKMSYFGADKYIEIENIDSPLISMGGRRLYGECEELPDLEKGFAYCLYNNKWNTNFPMWYEEDGYFLYLIHLHGN